MNYFPSFVPPSSFIYLFIIIFLEWDASVLLMNSVWCSLTLYNPFSMLSLFSVWQVPSKYHLCFFNRVYLYVCVFGGAGAYVWGSDDSLCWRSPPSTTRFETGSLCCSHLSRPGSDLRAPRACRVSTSHLAIRAPVLPHGLSHTSECSPLVSFPCVPACPWFFPVSHLCVPGLSSGVSHCSGAPAPPNRAWSQKQELSMLCAPVVASKLFPRLHTLVCWKS